MGLSSLSLKFNAVASRLMGLSAPSISTMAVDGTELVSGDNGFWATLGQIILNQLSDVVSLVADTLIQMVYAIGQWALVIIDFLFAFVRQFVGMNMDFDNIEDLAQGDLIFQFIFNENVLRIIRNLIIFGIVLLILFSIFAIIKSEYDYVTQHSDNSKGKILSNAMKSLFLMIFVPVVAIGSIIMSNAILKSLYLATSGGNTSMSMGTQIFLASSYDANAYRRYANNDLKIPITFNFDSINSNDVTTGYYTDGTVAEMESAIKEFKNQSVWSRGFTTYLMFATNAFLNMSDLDEMDRAYEKNGKVSPYHDVYDEGIFTRAEQYYIMADVIEYAMKKNTAIYFKTIEEVYESYEKIPANLRGKDYASNPISKSGDSYTVSVRYDGDSSISKFVHEKGKTDEAKGAVFVIALEKTIVVNEGKTNEKTYSYYYPLINGKNDFATDYYSGTGNVVIAKGLFEEGKNPTAIKEDDGVVQFYRDDLNIPMLADLFPKISYEMPAGSFEDLGTKLLKGAFTALTGVDISQFIPYVYFSVDFFHMFTKKSYVISDLDNGRMKLNYSFTSKDFDMKNVYKLGSFNIVIFAIACVLLLGILIKILFGVIYRVLDITMLAIMYPTVLSTIPIDDGSRFQSWVKQFATKIVSIYAVVVGINLVLLLVPIASHIKIFTKSDFIKISNGGKLYEWGAMATAEIYNRISDILFMLVAFSSIDPIIRILNDYAGENGYKKKDKKDKKKDYSSKIMEDGDKAVNDLKSSVNRLGNVVTGKFIVDAGKEVLETASQMALPGVQVVAGAAKSIQDNVDKFTGKKVQKETLKHVMENVGLATDKGSGQSSDQPSEEKDNSNDQSDADEKNEATETKEGLEDATQGNDSTVDDLKNQEVMNEGGSETSREEVEDKKEKEDASEQKGDAQAQGGKNETSTEGTSSQTENSGTETPEASGEGGTTENSRTSSGGANNSGLDGENIGKNDDLMEETETSENNEAPSDGEENNTDNAGTDNTETENEDGSDNPETSGTNTENGGETSNGDADDNLEAPSDGGGSDDSETFDDGDGNEDQYMQGNVELTDKNNPDGSLNPDENDDLKNEMGSQIPSEEEFKAIDPNEFTGKSKSLAGKVAGYAGGLALRTVATTAKLAGRLTLAVGKLAVGLTKTALKMTTRLVKASWGSLVNLAKQRESGKSNYTDALFGLTGAMAQTLGVGVAGLTKTGLQFAGNVTKASAKAVKGYAGNVFYPTKKNAKLKGLNSDAGSETTENGETEQNDKNQTGENNTNNENSQTNTDDSNKKDELKSEENDNDKKDEPQTKTDGKNDETKNNSSNKNGKQKNNNKTNQNKGGQTTSVSEGSNGVNVVVNVNDNPLAYSVVDKKAKDSGVDISVTKETENKGDDSTEDEQPQNPENEQPQTPTDKNSPDNGKPNNDGNSQQT